MSNKSISVSKGKKVHPQKEPLKVHPQREPLHLERSKSPIQFKKLTCLKSTGKMKTEYFKELEKTGRNASKSRRKQLV